MTSATATAVVTVDKPSRSVGRPANKPNYSIEFMQYEFRKKTRFVVRRLAWMAAHAQSERIQLDACNAIMDRAYGPVDKGSSPGVVVDQRQVFVLPENSRMAQAGPILNGNFEDLTVESGADEFDPEALDLDALKVSAE